MSIRVTLFAVAIGLWSGIVQAEAPRFQTAPLFSTAPVAVSAFPLPPEAKAGMRNVADLTPAELEEAFASPSCEAGAASQGQLDKGPTVCYACTGLGCTGVCYRIPCGQYVNASDVTPPLPGFRSFIPGCDVTYVSTCNDISNTPPCQGFYFQSRDFPFCIDSNQLLLQSVGCVRY